MRILICRGSSYIIVEEVMFSVVELIKLIFVFIKWSTRKKHSSNYRIVISLCFLDPSNIVQTDCWLFRVSRTRHYELMRIRFNLPNLKFPKKGREKFWALLGALDFLGAHILLCKKEKKTLVLQIFSQIGKTMKKLQWIPNTIVNTSVFETFW